MEKKKAVIEQVDDGSWYAAVYVLKGKRWQLLNSTTLDTDTMALSWIGATLTLFRS